MTRSDAPAGEPDALRAFTDNRGRLVGIAYRMLGSMAEAEDVAQEAWLRWDRADHAEVADLDAYLVRITTRLAIDRLRREAARREEYVGPWLPEPLLTGGDVAEQVERTESLALALPVVLETLSPLERAVSVPREAFAYPYAEIAEILGRSEPAVRQLARRARDHVAARRPRFPADHEERRRVTEQFLAAVDGDLSGLMAALAPGVTLVGDSGGRVLAPRRPLLGADNVARFMLAIATRERGAKFMEALAPDPRPDLLSAHIAPMNGDPGIVITYAGEPVTVIVLDVADGAVQAVHMIANPDKLSGLSARAA